MRKYYILLATFLFSTGGAFSQDFVYSPSTSVHTELEADSYSTVDIFIETPDLSGITFAWEKIEDNMLFGWDYSLCDYNSCYFDIPYEAVMSPISDEQMADGVNGFFKVTLNPGEVYGEGNLKLYVYDESDPTMGDTVNFTFNLSNLASIEEDNIGLSVYPNPCQGQLNVTNNASERLDYSIYNVSGEVILQGFVAEDNVKTLDLSGLTKGVYFFSSISGTGAILTEKIIIE